MNIGKLKKSLNVKKVTVLPTNHSEYETIAEFNGAVK